jgi:hypothetical protein
VALNLPHYSYLSVGRRHGDFTLLNAAVFPQIMALAAPLLRCTDVSAARCLNKLYAEYYHRWTELKFPDFVLPG